jgi:hypothetical protein
MLDFAVNLNVKLQVLHSNSYPKTPTLDAPVYSALRQIDDGHFVKASLSEAFTK